MSLGGGEVWDESYVASEAISQYRTVIFNTTTDEIVSYPSAARDAGIAGVTQESASASGDIIRVRKAGHTRIEVGAAVDDPGLELAIHDTVGRASHPSVAWASGDGIIGVAEETAAASGDIITCWLNIREAH